MKWTLLVLPGLAALVAIVTIIGMRLPRDHRVSRTLRVPRPPADAWPVVTRLASASSEAQFGGTWTIEIAPVDGGSTISITEDGWVASPIFRFISLYIIGHYATLDGLLKKVAKELQ